MVDVNLLAGRTCVPHLTGALDKYFNVLKISSFLQMTYFTKV